MGFDCLGNFSDFSDFVVLADVNLRLGLSYPQVFTIASQMNSAVACVSVVKGRAVENNSFGRYDFSV